MNPPAHDLKSIFGKALELESPEDRARYLAEACGDNAELSAEVESLLKALGHAGGFLESPAVETTVTVAPTPLIEGPGTVIGPYKLLEQIGEGGMGFVYMAEQSRPVRRKVALKIIKPGMDTKQVIARFEAERQALALMEHPNIARVYDGGATDSGRPYFVMELVRGIPITDYCDQVHLPIPERLNLFVQVCLAVQHAHQKGVIHRDLKPSNVLVTLHDSMPVPKVIDFGIAKVMGQQLTEKTLFTGFAQLVGTPLYMSPEQAALSGLDIDTRSDVYSLGVLLYELLTGTTPFDQDTFRKAALDEIRRIIREQEPPKPSTRISSLGITATTASENRQTDLRRLGKLMRGELDWIVMKCLEKDRTRRYDTINGLAADLRRYLAQEPVEAGPPSAWYRLRKLARRNRVALATASVVAASLVAVAVVSVLYADRQRRSAIEKAEAARKNSALAGDLKTSLAESNRLLAIRNFDRGQAAFEQDQIGSGLLWMIESWRSAIAAGDPAWQRAARANLAAWQPHHPRLKAVLSHPAPVDAAAFSPDGKTIVTGGDDHKARLWDAATARPIGSPLPHEGEVMSVAFSPDGKAILTGSTDKTARLWDAATGRSIGLALQHPDQVLAVAFSPDARIILTGCRDQTARLWDAATGRPVESTLQHQYPVGGVAFSSDGKTILTESFAGGARLWDASGRPIGPPLTSGSQVRSAALSADGRTVLTGSQDATVQLWDAATGQPIGSPLKRHSNRVRGVAFRTDGRFFLTGSTDKTAQVWDAVTRQPIGRLLQHQGPVVAVAFSPDGKTFLTASSDSTVKLWDADPGQPLGLVLDAESLGSAAFSPDGKTFLTVSSDGAGRAGRLKDVVTGRPIGPPSPDPQFVKFVAIGPDGKTLLTGGAKRDAQRWDAETGRPISGPLSHPNGPIALAFSPDGRTIVTGGQDYTVRLWDAATGAPLCKPLPQPGTVETVAFSPDGKSFLTAYATGAVQLWDRGTLTPLGEPFPHPGCVSAAAFSPDGKLLITGCEDSMARLWQVQTRTPLVPPLRHQDWVWDVAFSPDGKTILTSSADRTARLWDVATGTLLGPDYHHTATVSGLAFHPAGKSFLVGDGAQTRIFRTVSDLPDDPERIATWVECLTGLTLDPQHGVIQVLDNAAWLTKHERLKALGGPPLTDVDPRLDPILFGPDPLARVRAWVQRGRWDAAEVAFDELMDARPYNAAHWLERGRFDLGRAQPAKAAAHFGQAILHLPEHLGIRHGQILSLLALGDEAGLRRACSDLLDRFGRSAGSQTANNVAWYCALAADAVADRGAPVRLAERAANGASDAEKPMYLNTLGAALYRAGRFEEAIRSLEEGSRERGGASFPQDWVFLAMAHHRLGHDAEAHSWLERFRTYRPSEKPADFWDELEIRLLRREAQAVVVHDAVFPSDPFARH